MSHFRQVVWRWIFSGDHEEVASVPGFNELLQWIVGQGLAGARITDQNVRMQRVAGVDAGHHNCMVRVSMNVEQIPEQIGKWIVIPKLTRFDTHNHFVALGQLLAPDETGSHAGNVCHGDTMKFKKLAYISRLRTVVRRVPAVLLSFSDKP